MENSNLETEQEAIARLKGGDLQGMETLVRRYQLQAIRAAYLITGDRPAAEDIVQEAFLRAAERIHQFDDSRPFRPWFLRSVVNDAIKAATRSNRRVSLDAQETEGSLEWLPDPAPSPEELAQNEENRLAVQRALLRLKPEQRAVVVMRYYLEMDHAEISSKVGDPVGTIKWRLHEARKRLQRLLASPLGKGNTNRACPDKRQASRNWRKP